MNAAGGPVPIVRRAPAAGLFGRRGGAAGKIGTIPVFPWEDLLFAPDPDAPPRPTVIIRFPLAKR